MLRATHASRLLSLRRACLQSKHLHASAQQLALSKFQMPAMSPTMTEGGIASWKKKEGDSFAPGDVLLEIETDKATMDVEAQDEGVLAKILVQEGSKAVQVGTPIAIMAEDSEDVKADEVNKLAEEAQNEKPSSGEQEASSKKEDQQQPKKEESKKEDQPAKESTQKKEQDAAPKKSTSQPSSDRPVILATPVAKRLALERGVPLGQLKGSGPDGRILKEDVEKYKPAAAGAPSSSSSSSSPAAAAAPAAAYNDIPNSNMRRTIAARLTESKRDTPHYYLTVEVNMDRVNSLRELFNSAAAKGGNKDGVKEGTKLSVNDFIVKAAALAHTDVPEVNAGWQGDFVRQYTRADIAMAVATPTGLITPIIRDAGALGLSAISAQSKALAAKARDGKLKPDEYQGGSFTISNLGMMGIEHFTAIINPPGSCILAIGAAAKKLVLDDASERGFKEVSVMKATMSCDHRVVDGAVGARWLQAFKRYLESPLSFML